MIFAGGDEYHPSFFNDAWVLTNANGLGGGPTWNQLTANGDPGSPSQRSYPSAAYNSADNHLTVFGGYNGCTNGNNVNNCTGLQDAWYLTNANGLGGAPSWKLLNPTGTPANPVALAAYDISSDRMIEFGGNGTYNTASPSLLSDTWVLTNATLSDPGGIPGTVTFSAPTFAVPDVPSVVNTATTTATFSLPGIYQLQLRASDSQLVSTSDVTVTVNTPASPTIVSVVPNSGQQGQQNLPVTITGQFTNFVQGTTTANFGAGITVVSLTVSTPTSATAVINIDPATAIGAHNVSLTSGSEIDTLTSGFNITASTPIPTITSVSPISGQQGRQNLSVAIAGQFTHFVQGTTQSSFGSGITVTSLTVNSPVGATAVINIDAAASPGTRTLTLTTGSETATFANGFMVTASLNQAPVVSAGANQTINLTSDLFVAGENTSDVLRFNSSTGALIDAFVPAGSGGLSMGNDMVIGPDGNLYVTSQTAVHNSQEKGAVLRYNGITGSFIDAFVPLGSGGLRGPTELIFGPDGNLYVSDYWDQNVKRYNGSTGAFLGIFTSGGSPLAPQGLRFGADGNLYLADELQVLRYNGSTGAYIGVFVPAGSGGLQEPQCIVFGPDGNLYVSDPLGHAVRRYSGTTGAFIDSFIAPGSGGINLATGIDFGPDGNLYVGDQAGGQILRYDGHTGAFLNVFVPAGTGGLTGSSEALAYIQFENSTSATLNGSFSDDGLPLGSTLTATWSKVSGPGPVAFGNSSFSASNAPGHMNSASTTVGFTIPGTYVLRLTASDSQLSSNSDLTITVSSASAAPTLSSVVPNAGQQGQQNLSVVITGQNTHFTQASTQVSFGSDMTVNSVTVGSATALTANITIPAGANLGAHLVSVRSGPESVSLNNGFTVQPGNTCVSPPSGMLGWWPGDGNANDIVGQNNGTLVDNVLFPPGEVGRAFGLNEPGPIEPYNCPTCAYLSITQNFPASTNAVTVAAWVYADQSQQSQGSIEWVYTQLGEIAGPPGTSGPQLGIVGNAIFWRPNGDNEGQFSSPGLVPPNTWTLLVGTYDTTTGQSLLYVNGNLVWTQSLSGAVPLTNTAYIGKRVDLSRAPGQEFWVGRIDELQLFGRALSASEVQAIFNAGTAGECKGLNAPSIAIVNPNLGQQGQQNLSVAIMGLATNFVQGTSQVSLGQGITVESISVTDSTHLTAKITISANAPLGVHDVSITTGSEQATLQGGFTVAPCTSTNTNWLQLTQAGNIPGPREQHTTVYDQASNRLIAFGGYNCSIGGGGLACTTVRNDVWILTNANGLGGASSWTELNPTGIPPSARRGHSAAYDAVTNRMIVFAGNSDSTLLNDVWVLVNANGLGGTPTWQQLSPNGTPPAPRRFTQALYDGAANRLIVFGGEVPGPSRMNDTWVLTNANGLGGAPSWIQLNPAGVAPSPRAFHFANLDTGTNRLIVFGGGDVVNGVADDPSLYRNDVWVLVNANGLGGTPAWIPLLAQGLAGSPSPRLILSGTSASIYLAGAHRFIISGGQVGQCEVSIVACNSSSISNEVWMLSNADGTGSSPFWTKLSLSGGPQRTLGDVVYDSSSDRMINYGGGEESLVTTNTTAADTWLLTNVSGGSSCGVLAPAIILVNPAFGQQGQNLPAAIMGQNTHFVQGTTQASFGSGITVASLTVNSATGATAVISIDAAASPGARTVTLTTGPETASFANGFTVTASLNQPPIVSAGPNQTVIKPELFIAANNSNRILRFDATSGTFIDEFVPAGYGGLYWPDGVIFGPDDNLYVTSATNAANAGPRGVLRFNGSTGAFIDAFVPPGSGGLQVATYQTFGPDGNLYVSDYGDGTVKRYNGITGAFIDVFASGAFAPQGLQFGPDGNLYVADQVNVRRYNGLTGAFIDLFVLSGSGGLNQPQGLVFGPDGNLYLSGYLSGAVLRYNGSTGAFIDVFASGNGLVSPQGMAFDPAGNLYVGDVNNGQVLRYDGKTGAFLSVFVPAGSQGLTGAGTNQALAAITFRTVKLQGLMSDDGLPNGSTLTGSWSTISGPGTVTFSNPLLSVPDIAGKSYAVAESVGFSAAGTYVLQLTASDSQLNTSAGVTITVNPPLQAPAITSVSPNMGQQGVQNATVTITGQNTHFAQGTTQVSFGAGVTATTVSVSSPTVLNIVLNIDPAAALGARTITVTTNSEVVTLANGFTVTASSSLPIITAISPSSGPAGLAGPVAIVGQNTHFVQGTTTVDLGPGITVTNVQVSCPTCLTAQVSIAATAQAGPHNVTVTTGTEVAVLSGGFTVIGGTPILTSLVPASGQQGQSLQVTITGQNTRFTQGTTLVSFGSGITVSSINVSSATSLTAQLAIDPTAALGTRTLTVTTGTEVVSVPNVFTVGTAPTPALISLRATSGQQGQSLPVAIVGQNTHFTQGTTQVDLGAGITVTAVTVSDASHVSAQLAIAANATLGTRTLTVTTGSEVVTWANVFTVQSATIVILSLNPGGTYQGQTASVSITGQGTHFVQGTTQAQFGAGVAVVAALPAASGR